jgi:hypothetical protein
MDEERIGPKPVTNRAAGAAAFTKRAHDPFLEYTSMASRRYRDLLDACSFSTHHEHSRSLDAKVPETFTHARATKGVLTPTGT